MNLKQWGWDQYYIDKFNTLEDKRLVPGRIVLESRHLYEIETDRGRYKAKVSGHYNFTALNRSDYPTIGDWVGIRIENDIALIETLIKRKSSFSRKRAGSEVSEQVIASNIDYIFLVFGLDGGRNFSAGAVERFLTRAWDSGAEPVIVLNKSDICDNKEDYLYQTEVLAAEVPVYLTSAKTLEGLEELKQYIKPGKTVAFIGFSGVGKSALINSLCGVDLMKTGAVRGDDLKGRHTTTHKELVLLDQGGILIDSPGIKELQLWGNDDSLDASFDDIAEIAEGCKFRDCSHTGEPGCAVQNALDTGKLDHRRFENYLDMKKELIFLESKTSVQAGLEEKAKLKDLSKRINSLHRR